MLGSKEILNGVIMVEFDIYPNEHLVVAYYEGRITFADVVEVTGRMIVDPRYQQEFDGVSDYRNGEINFTVKEVIAFSDAAAQNKIASGRWCILVSRPQETALLSLFKSHLKAQHPVELFCTINAASEYLGRDLSKYLAPGLYN